jgi:hypothetical protein
MHHRILSALAACLVAGVLHAEETIWLEAEHLDGIQGYVMPSKNAQDARHGVSGPETTPQAPERPWTCWWGV